MFPANVLSTPLDDAECEALDALLLSLDSDASIYCLSELDGFLTAVVSGPDMIMPSEWLDAVWGGPDSAPEWADEAEFQHFFGLMVRHMNGITATLMEAPEEFEPCFMESPGDEGPHLLVDEWCFGYMRGVLLRADAWCLRDDDVVELLGPIPLFADEPGRSMLDEMDDDAVRELQLRIAPAARAVHAYWLAQRTPDGGVNPYIRPQPKVGRNDPCPCGSGKKYKKCCGLH